MRSKFVNSFLFIYFKEVIMALKILVAPSGFKESLGAEEVAHYIEIGIKRVYPDAIVRKAPLVDGGEGFTKALVQATGGTLHFVTVTGPVGKKVFSHFGFLGGTEKKTAVLEMAAAAGLWLVPKSGRNPLVTTTYGVGELIKAALDAGAERILIGCGDSGTNDGGAGMAQALGVKLLDKTGAELGFGGQYLKRLAKIEMSNRDARLDEVQIDVACNWHNVLCGENGVARVFGPQKGASPETVQMLADSLDNFAEVIEKDLQIDVRTMNGGGASGGLGAGLFALIGATLHPRYEIVMQYLELDELLKDSDLVLTAEGGIDFQTPRGKIPAEVANRAKRYGLPVIALAGTVGKGAKINYDHGIDSFLSILDKPCSLSEAIENAPSLLKHAAERTMRFLMIGQQIKTLGI
jgi:glycerate kinase